MPQHPGTKGAFKAFEVARTREIEPPGYFRQEVPESETMQYEELKQHVAALETRIRSRWASPVIEISAGPRSSRRSFGHCDVSVIRHQP